MDDYSQTAFVTHDLQRSVRHWHAIGAGPFAIVNLGFLTDPDISVSRSYRGRPARDSFIAAIGFLGTTQIELVQPTNAAPSVFREILDQKGEVLHHVQAKVSVVPPAMFDELSRRYENLGYALAASMTTPTGIRVAFYDAFSELGCFLEIAEKTEQAFNTVRQIYQAHLEREHYPPIIEWPSA